MTNQLDPLVQSSLVSEQLNPLEGFKRSQPEIVPQPKEAIANHSKLALPQWFGGQSVKRKHLVSWVTSGILSIASIAAAGAWFSASVDQIPQDYQRYPGQSVGESTIRPEAVVRLAMQQTLLAIALVMATNTGVMLLLYRAIAKPVKQLQQETHFFALGAHQVRADVTTADEIGHPTGNSAGD